MSTDDLLINLYFAHFCLDVFAELALYSSFGRECWAIHQALVLNLLMVLNYLPIRNSHIWHIYATYM